MHGKAVQLCRVSLGWMLGLVWITTISMPDMLAPDRRAHDTSCDESALRIDRRGEQMAWLIIVCTLLIIICLGGGKRLAKLLGGIAMLVVIAVAAVYILFGSR
jgi:hypothetical protein